jgi:hypothetical protein
MAQISRESPLDIDYKQFLADNYKSGVAYPFGRWIHIYFPSNNVLLTNITIFGLLTTDIV